MTFTTFLFNNIRVQVMIKTRIDAKENAKCINGYRYLVETLKIQLYNITIKIADTKKNSGKKNLRLFSKKFVVNICKR